MAEKKIENAIIEKLADKGIDTLFIIIMTVLVILAITYLLGGNVLHFVRSLFNYLVI